jgi:hypothetical protein
MGALSPLSETEEKAKSKKAKEAAEEEGKTGFGNCQSLLCLSFLFCFLLHSLLPPDTQR